MLSRLADGQLPLRARHNSVLEVSHHFKSTLGQLACTFVLLNRDLVRVSLMAKRLDRANDRGCACSKRLVDSLFLDCLYHFLNLEWLYRHLELFQFLEQSQQRLPCDSGKNSAIERRSNQLVFSLLVLPENEEVHGAHFSHVIMQQPQCLVCTVLLVADSLSLKTWSVVS